MTFAALFPGQLSEKAGMGEALAAHDYVGRFYEEVRVRSGVDVAATFFGAGSPQLHDDLPAQVGVFAVSLAALDVLEREHGVRPEAAAGYSLGTYAAFVAAGALDRWAALEVVLELERLLRDEPVAGQMGYVIGLVRERLDALLLEVSGDPAVLSVGNENAAQQFVLTGEPWAVEAAIGKARPLALRAELLPIGWPMHSARLSGLCDRLAAFVARNVTVRAPERAALYAPMLAGRVHDAATAAEVLARQVSRPSRWEAMLRAMHADGLTRFAEVGPGDVLAKLTRWTLRTVRVLPAEDPQSLAALSGRPALERIA